MAGTGNRKLNGGQIIVDYLIREKVPYAFGLSGHGNIGFSHSGFRSSVRFISSVPRQRIVVGFDQTIFGD